jgi:hypothetical protein
MSRPVSIIASATLCPWVELTARRHGLRGQRVAQRSPGSQHMIEAQPVLSPSYIIACHPSKTTWHADSTAQVFVFASLYRTPRLLVSSCVPRKRLLHGRGACLTRSTTSPRESPTMRDSTLRAAAGTGAYVCLRSSAPGKDASGRHHDRGPALNINENFLSKCHGREPVGIYFDQISCCFPKRTA